MRTVCKTLFAALALFSVLPSALAQTTCTEQDLSQVITCLNTDNLPTCLAQNPGCTDDDLDMQIAADELGNRVFSRCCGKNSKNKRLSCLTQAKNSLKTTPVRNLVPQDVLSELSANIDTVANTVRSSGSCASG